MEYRNILISNLKRQSMARLSVGMNYNNYQVTKIWKTGALLDEMKAAGSYCITFLATSGNEYHVRNNQSSNSGRRYCLVGSGGQEAEVSVPRVLASLALDSNKAEFSDPL